MLTYNEMIGCRDKYTHNERQMLIAKYKAFIDYLKKIIMIIFKDNEEQIASYLNETSDKTILLDWCMSGIHYDGFHIGTSDGKTLNVTSLRAHDSYYDPVLKLNSNINDEEILYFFNNEYKKFIELFIPNYSLEDCVNHLLQEKYSLVWKITVKLNEAIFDKFKVQFSSFGINDIQSFIESKFSLNFTDERRCELDKKVYEKYNYSYSEKINEITKKFNESVKDLK